VLRQGAAAAAWLIELSERHGDVLAVTHVNVRAHIAAALLEAGWQRGPGGSRFAPWSAWTFIRSTPSNSS
jgi:hypothetical protein